MHLIAYSDTRMQYPIRVNYCKARVPYGTAGDHTGDWLGHNFFNYQHSRMRR